MPWNKPGRTNPNQNKPAPPQKRKNPSSPSGPIDLEALLRQLGKWMNKGRGRTPNTSPNKILKRFFTAQFLSRFGIFIISVLLLLWLASGILRVHADEQVLVTRFGQYQRTLLPGYHWVSKPFEQTLRISQKSQTLTYQGRLILTDQNPASFSATLTYSIIHPLDYAFNTAFPLANLKKTINTAFYQQISPFSFTSLLAANRTELAEKIKATLNTQLKSNKMGIFITQVILNPVDIPSTLKAAFDEVNTARSNQMSLENEAKVNAMQLTLQTQGEAEHLIEEAQNYQQTVILKAKNEVALFLAQLPSYKLAPQLTQKRLYFSALQAIMPYSHTIFLTGSDAPPPMQWIVDNKTEATTSPQSKNTPSIVNEMINEKKEKQAPQQQKTSANQKMLEFPSSYENAADYNTGGYDDNTL